MANRLGEPIYLEPLRSAAVCTISIIPLPEVGGEGGSSGGYRLVTNRDERRTRNEALPPRWRKLYGEPAHLRAVWPTDTEAGGTWVAAAETGLTLAILSLDSGGWRAPEGRERQSRGHVIPELIGAADVNEAAQRFERLDLAAFPPFRLIAADGLSGVLRVAEMNWAGDHRLPAVWDGPRPLCFVSSGLGGRAVEPRLDLFEETVVGAGATPEAQDEFHRHRWPDRPEVSVLMARDDARTVSICTVEARPTLDGDGPERPPWRIKMLYSEVPERPPAPGDVLLRGSGDA